MPEEIEGAPTERPPRDNLVRLLIGSEVRAVVDAEPTDGRLGMLFGRMANYNQWAEVNSVIEGHFMERVLPGAFTKTFAENRSRMQIIFDHGQDRNIGRKPMAPLETVSDDQTGLDYGGPLLDTSYNRDLMPGLRAGLYGSSYRFGLVKDDWIQRPKRSDYNPQGLPERTIREAKVIELGPTPFPVYDGTSAGIRSVTDDYLLRQLSDHNERADGAGDEPHSEPEPGEPTPVAERAEPVKPPVAAPRRFRSNQDWSAYLQEINR